jgi:hypothetical protein
MKTKAFLLYAAIITSTLLLSSCGKTKKDWESASKINTVEAYNVFLANHPSSRFTNEAKSRIDTLEYYMWPPLKLTSIPKDFPQDAVLNFKDWVNVKVNGEEHMAFISKNGKAKLSSNLFSPDKPMEGSIDNQFEVVYFDENQTLISADSTKNDKIIFIYLGIGNLKETFSYPGMHVRYQGKVYELRKDGWYLNNRIIHKF